MASIRLMNRHWGPIRLQVFSSPGVPSSEPVTIPGNSQISSIDADLWDSWTAQNQTSDLLLTHTLVKVD